MGANGKLYEPASPTRQKRMVPGTHWIYVHRKGPADLPAGRLAQVAAPGRAARRRRRAARVVLSDADEEPPVVLRSPHYEHVLGRTGATRWHEAPSSEGLDGTLRWVYMSTYQQGYTPDLVLRGRDLGFRVVIQHDPTDYPATTDPRYGAIDAVRGETASDIRAWLRADLVARGLSGADADALVATVTLVETTIGNLVGHADPWGEDNKWTTRGTDASSDEEVDIVYPADGVSGPELARAEQLALTRGYHAIAGTAGGFLGAVTARDLDEAAAALARELGRHRRRTDVYIEGGNLLSGTQASRWPYALVGWDSLVVSMIHMLGAGRLDEHDVELAFAHMRRDPTEHADLLRDLRRVGYFDPPPSDPDALEVANTFLADAPTADAAEQERVTWQVLAFLEATRLVMIDDVRVAPANFAIIDQLDFHNDMHMRPLGGSTVLLNDLVQARDLVKRVIDAGPPAAERAALLDMHQWCQREAPSYVALTDRVEAQCRALGLRVVRCPGVFRMLNPLPSSPYPPPDPCYRWANFMNAVPGTVPPGAGAALPDGTTFYMTNATSLTSLQQAFRDWLVGAGVGVQEVYFLGGEVAVRATAGQGPLTCSELWAALEFPRTPR